ncbi:hypothetical protein VTL71DRAFT_7643 [Oculimacula yallundae]|uniref:Uncharacterized protein n=1 Tax=Oculimacula yallundae TaxID=86028 RepID=A0ABR4BUP2_9HELO
MNEQRNISIPKPSEEVSLYQINLPFNSLVELRKPSPDEARAGQTKFARLARLKSKEGESTMAQQQHHHDSSIPHSRLSQALPLLPLHLPMSEPIELPHLSISTQIPYHDDPAEDGQSPSQPPGYEPMYDYLRSHQRASQAPTNHECPEPSNQSIPQEQYRDEPFVVTIDENDSTQLPPPSYNELYRQNEQERDRLMRQFDMDGTPAEQTEEMVKWVVAMLLICFTIAFAGTAFNWGRPR